MSNSVKNDLKKFETAKGVQLAKITREHLKAWMQRYNSKVYMSEIETDNGKNAKFYICKPSRSVMSFVQRYQLEGNIQKVESILLKNSVLGGNMELLKDESDGGDDSVIMAVLQDIMGTMEIAPSKLEKLDNHTFEKFKDVYSCVIEYNDNETTRTAVFTIAKPNRIVRHKIAKSQADNKISKVEGILIKECVLDGDIKLLKEEREGGFDSVYRAITTEIAKLMERKNSEIKKLSLQQI